MPKNWHSKYQNLEINSELYITGRYLSFYSLVKVIILGDLELLYL